MILYYVFYGCFLKCFLLKNTLKKLKKKIIFNISTSKWFDNEEFAAEGMFESCRSRERRREWISL